MEFILLAENRNNYFKNKVYDVNNRSKLKKKSGKNHKMVNTHQNLMNLTQSCSMVFQQNLTESKYHSLLTTNTASTANTPTMTTTSMTSRFE